MKKHPIQRARDIVLKRSEEQKRKYGSFQQNFFDAAAIASIIRNKWINSADVCACLFAIKLAREKYGHKEDNFVDGLAYFAALFDEIEKERKESYIYDQSKRGHKRRKS